MAKLDEWATLMGAATMLGRIRRYLCDFSLGGGGADKLPGLDRGSILQSFVFNESANTWLAEERDDGDLNPKELTVATFNIWFDEYFFERRVAALLKILCECDADIVGLQEITQESLDLLLSEPWVRENYCVSDVDGGTFEDYGVVVLSRIPIRRLKLYVLPGSMARRAVVAECFLNGEMLQVAVTHLESYKHSTQVRIAQLHAIYRFLEESENALIMGDFNFCSSWPENSLLDQRYSDLWGVLRPDEPGYTEDTEINRMRAFVTRKHKQVRFDRMLLRSKRPGWSASKVARLGMAPIASGLPLVFPSDHFGLVSRLEWQGGAPTS